MYASGPPATAVLIRDGRIAWIGDECGADAVAATARAVGSTVQLDGCLLTPAFVDAHVHLAATGLAVGVPDLSGARSAGQLLDAVAAAARGLEPGRTVLGFGWDESTWDDPVLPGPAELARASGGRPAFLGRVDVHSALITGPAVGPGGDLQTLRDPLVRWDDRPGAVTLPGVMAGLLTRADRRALIAAALDVAAATGIGFVHEMAAPQLAELDDLALVDELGALLRPGEDDLGTAAGRAGQPVRPLVAAWWGQHAAAGGVAAAAAAGGDRLRRGSVRRRVARLAHGRAAAALSRPAAGDRG